LAFHREEGLAALVRRRKAGQAEAPPVRRVERPTGQGKTRPLGMPPGEDRRLQRAVARLLSARDEEDFRACSFGYRTGRHPPRALQALRDPVGTGPGRDVYATDSPGDCTHSKQEWLRTMSARRMAAPVITGRLGTWGNAGVMEHGVGARPAAGTPHGGPRSPGLANGSLPYGIDRWVAQRGNRARQGEASWTRFVDEWVVACPEKQDAADFARTLKRRLPHCGRRIAPEKTRRGLLGRCARTRGGGWRASGNLRVPRFAARLWRRGPGEICRGPDSGSKELPDVAGQHVGRAETTPTLATARSAAAPLKAAPRMLPLLGAPPRCAKAQRRQTPRGEAVASRHQTTKPAA
jgi:hypothetical protein